MTKILRITTVQESLESLLKGQLKFLKTQGYDLSMASAITAHDRIEALEKQEGCKHYNLPLTRKITPIKDFIAIWKTYKLIRKLKPTIVHTHTPKAGMVGMIAAWFARVPIRLHTVAGLPLMEKEGFIKKILIGVERITYAFATQIYPNSFGLKDYINHHISRSHKIKVIGQGSSNGINTLNFSKSKEIINEAQLIRAKLNININDYVWIFVGRVVGDKGINELVEAFDIFQKEYPNNALLIVGPYEKGLDPLKAQTENLLESHEKIFHVGFQKDIRPYLCLSNSLVFPSYREGFPNVPMQAACMGLSLILSDINGCNELIKNNESGLLIPPKSVVAIINSMKRLYLSKEFGKQLGINAYNEVIQKYSQPVVWNHILSAYKSLLKQVIK
jgi:glycosyltransferase involved in cell wall biosynthesis